MTTSINLAQQIPDKEIRKQVARVFYGIVPRNGKMYSIRSIASNENYYRKLAEAIENNGSKKRGSRAL